VNQGGEPVKPATVKNPDTLTGQVICASELLAPCDPSFGSSPRSTGVVLLALLALPKQPSMPDPCAGVPANPWCPAGGQSPPPPAPPPAAPPAQAVSTAPKLTG